MEFIAGPPVPLLCTPRCWIAPHQSLDVLGLHAEYSRYVDAFICSPEKLRKEAVHDEDRVVSYMLRLGLIQLCNDEGPSFLAMLAA